jgi:hypothetical protein
VCVRACARARANDEIKKRVSKERAVHGLILKIQYVSFETAVCTYKFTRRYGPENKHRHFHGRHKLRSHGNEPLGSIIGGKYLDQLSNYKLLKKDCAVWNQFRC